jgi:hypothetical protein
VCTLVLGASTNPERYSYKAILRLDSINEKVIALGKAGGKVGSHQFIQEWPHDQLDTITLYLNPKNQEQYFDDIIRSKPRRVIFNPGTENPILAALCDENGIQALEACTLVLISLGKY